MNDLIETLKGGTVERGYVEAPVRVRAILRAIEPLGMFDRVEAEAFPERHIRAVHDDRFVDYLRAACARVEPGRSVYPYVFPIRNAARQPKDLALRAGYWCIDTFTPINPTAYAAARHGVDVTLTAAQQMRIKTMFDPDWLLNPGKVFPLEERGAQ